MRIFAIGLLLFGCAFASAQTPSPRGGGNRQPDPQAFTEALRGGAQMDIPVEVIYLNHAEASTTAKMLTELGVKGVDTVTADPRLNAIFLKADEEGRKEIKSYLKTIDSVAPDNETTHILTSDLFQHIESGGEMIKQIANTSGVTVAFDRELGIYMVKGPKIDVERTIGVLEKIEEASRRKRDQERDEQNRLGSFMIRVFWLSNDPSDNSSSEPDAALKKSILRLAELGHKNMNVKMQLLGRCDMAGEKGECNIDGSAVSGNTRRTLKVQSNLEAAGGAGIKGKFNIAATTSENAHDVEQASVQVAVNLTLDKYYILSATPVGGFQTAFVVQMIDGL